MRTVVAKNSRKSSQRGSRQRIVTFEYYAPQAKSVQLAANFNDWDPSATPLQVTKDGKWKAAVSLAPGRYEFRFFVDGDWQNAQQPVECVPNAFGTWNCVIEVH